MSTPLKTLRDALRLAQSEQTTARATWMELQRPGVSAADQDAASRALDAAKLGTQKAQRSLDFARAVALKDLKPSEEIARLEADLPLALLPARIETRYATRAGTTEPELRVRVYPDELHAESLEERLSPDEAKALKGYPDYRAMIRKSQTTQEREAVAKIEHDAWERLVSAAGGAPRAAYLLSTRGTEPGSRPAALWGRSEARLLPDRWVAVGFRRTSYGGFETLFEVTSARVQEPLALTADWSAELPDEDTIDDEARWTLDYTRALQVGMAITVQLAHYPQGRQTSEELLKGVDRLIVFGVKSTLSAQESAEGLTTLMQRHLYSRGLALVPQGTPTNNVTGGSSGWSEADDARRAAYSVTRGRASKKANTDGDRLLGALGLDPTPLAELTLQDGPSEDQLAQDAVAVLWPTTWGYALERLLELPPEVNAAVYDHARAYLRGRGPLPAFRVGNVPYGVLPVSSLGLWPSWQAGHSTLQDDMEHGLAKVLRELRSLWALALEGDHVPRVMGAADPAAALMEVLAQEGRSSGVIAQPVWTIANSSYDDFPHKYDIGRSALGDLLQTMKPPWPDRLPSPLLQSLAPDGPSPVDFGGVEYQRWATVEMHERAHGLKMSPRGLWFTLLLRRLVYKTKITSAPETAARWPTAVDEGFTDTVKRMNALTQDPPRLEAILQETLDLASHRLDAWITSLATRRLAELRRGGKTGLRLGAVAWVEDLKPAGTGGTAATGEFIHAPSLNHAAAAAVLRNAHRSSDDKKGEKYAFELSSARVRGALELIEGARRGMGLPEQLGYQIERELHEHALDHLIQPLRRVFALKPNTVGQTTSTTSESVEDTGPRAVLNGEAAARQMRDKDEGGSPLADRDPRHNGDLYGVKSGGEALRPGYIPWGDTVSVRGAVFPSKDSDEGRRLKVILARAADRLDALGDLLAAEAVYQGVMGQTDGLKAALDAMGRGGALPTPEITQSPISTRSVKHRVALVIGADHKGLPGWGDGQPGAVAEPRLHAALCGLLGPPEAYGCSVIAPDGRITQVTAANLGLAPWRLLTLATVGDPELLPAELRLRALRAAGWSSGEPWRIEPPAPSTGRRPLRDLLELARVLASLLGRCEPLTAQDCAPEELSVPSAKVALDGRLTALGAAFGALEDTLQPTRALLATYAEGEEVSPDHLWPPEPDGELSVTSVVNTLVHMADFGPFAPSPEVVATARGARDTAERRQAVAATQTELLNLFRGADAQLSAWRRAFNDETASGERRLGDAFGGALTVLPPFSLPTVANLPPEASAWCLRDALKSPPTSSDQLAPWLLEAARARPALAAWAEARRAAEAVHRRWRRLNPGASAPRPTLSVAQLPTPSARWIGLPGEHLGGETAWVFDKLGALDAENLAGLLIDAWTEAIPEREATTGVAIHHDDAGAEAPQAILLAVYPPHDGATTWNQTTLMSVLHETIELTKLRAVDLEALRARAAAAANPPTPAEAKLQELARMLPAIFIGLQNDPGGDLGLGFVRSMEQEHPGEED